MYSPRASTLSPAPGGRFFHTQEALDFLQFGISTALSESLDESGSGQRDDVIGYLRAVLLDSPFRRSLASNPVWVTRFDVETWRELNRGALSAPEAVIRRRLKLRGDLLLAIKLHFILG